RRGVCGVDVAAQAAEDERRLVRLAADVVDADVVGLGEPRVPEDGALELGVETLADRNLVLTCAEDAERLRIAPYRRHERGAVALRRTAAAIQRPVLHRPPRRREGRDQM